MHKFKHFQLWLHQHYDQVKLTLLVIVGLMVFSFSMFMIGNQNRLIEQVKTLGEQNHELNLQSRSIAKENQSIAKQNRSYTRCIAVIFAQYTHDFVPVTINNLDTCTINSQTRATDNTPTAGTNPDSRPVSSPKSTPKQSSASPGQSQATTQTAKPNTPPQRPSLLQRLISPVTNLTGGL